MSSRRFPYSLYLAPRYWGLWLAFALLRLLTLLPVRWSLAIGSQLGACLFHLAASRRRVARINIQQAYPDYDDEQVKRLNKACFRNLGRSIIETGYAWFGNREYLKRLSFIEGEAHLRQAMQNGKGVILLTGHFTTLEIGGIMVGGYVQPYNAVYKKAHNPLFNAMMTHCRSRAGCPIDNRNTRAILKTLKKGEVVWFAPDQDFANQDIVFKPFLGGIASTLTATAKMAKITGASVVPFYPLRLHEKDPAHPDASHKLVMLPALENFPGDDLERASERVNQCIEAMVYANPEQYGWMHKRFKTTPDRKNDFYQRHG